MTQNIDRIADSLSSIWDAIETSTIEDIPVLAEYIADNLEMSRLDKATLAICMVLGYIIGFASALLIWVVWQAAW